MATDTKPFIEHVAPLLPVVDMASTIAWYREKLGFKVHSIDRDENLPEPAIGYAVLVRDGAAVHMQMQFAKDCPPGRQIQLRFQVRNVDAVYADLDARGAVPAGKAPRDTDWGTREFGFFDPDGVGLHFYEDR